jgi:hypothetical protein
MRQKYYTLRIQIAGSQRVILETRDFENRSINEVAGSLGFTKKNRTRITELHDAARRAELNDKGVEELGTLLFSILFDDNLRREFLDVFRKAASEDALLRVELDVDEVGYPDIASMPWEFMYVPPAADCGALWLATAPSVVFTRRRIMGKVPEPVQLDKGERLRIALAVSAPVSLGKVHFEHVQDALEELSHSEMFELLEVVNPANRSSIDAVLEKKPHIFHFIGHGRLEDENRQDTGQVALEDSTGGEDWVSANNFSELFNRHKPGLVVLQSCETGALSNSRALVGLASQVVQKEIPAVAAMQFEISNASAKRFALEFYRRLANNEPVDKAAQEGRRKIALETGYDARDFATPVLFMRVREGRLFQRPPGEESNKTASDGKTDLIHLMQRLTLRIDDLDDMIFADVVSRLKKIAKSEMNDEGKKCVALVRQFLFEEMPADEFAGNWGAFRESTQQVIRGPDYRTLADRLNRGEIIPFLGSSVLRLSGFPVPSSPEMVRKMAQRVDYPEFDGSLSMLSQYCKSEKKYSRKMIIGKVKEVMNEDKQPGNSNPLYDLLVETREPLLMISSSYDDLLEQAFRIKNKKFVVLTHNFYSAAEGNFGNIQLKYPNKEEPEEHTAETISGLKLLENGYSIIYKLCGYFHLGNGRPADEIEESTPLMLLESDFFAFSTKLEKLIPSYIIRKFQSRGFLFFGYDLDEWQDRLIADTMLDRCPKDEDSFTVCKEPNPYEWSFWKSTHKLEIYREELGEFVDHLSTQMNQIDLEKTKTVELTG